MIHICAQSVTIDPNDVDARPEKVKHSQAGTTAQSHDSGQWIDLISQYTSIEKPDYEMLNRLIKQIVVHEDIDEDHARHIRLEIHFNFRSIPAVDQYDPADQQPYLNPDHSSLYVMAR